MTKTLPTLLPLLVLLCASATLPAQRPPRGAEPPVIGPDRSPQPAPVPAPAPGVRVEPTFDSARPPLLAPPQADDDPTKPRPAVPAVAPPFTSDRPLLEIDGVPLRAFELNELVAHYRSFRPGSIDLLLRDAVRALVPKLVCEAAYGADLMAMQARIAAAQEALAGGASFAEVAARFSDDAEAPAPDGRYTFGREQAVQPFDRLAFAGPIGQLQGPFLTQYGYHLLELLAYQRGDEPKDDRATVRHVLVIYPQLAEASDARATIRELVARCRIRVLDAGVANLVPPELRKNLVE